ncbi:hypothetical protein YS76_004794 [Salmonella enterica subsp. enterica serovar Oranienburg]|nr:hypothetical protein [Salmonella enterica subsp. enterica serovar Oranienburg]EAA7484461.1 hypothetical protein [Salmonella enterica subsp. enterica serovar Irumu]EAY4424167.1 hypothetical protein [Salmonella enterica]ECI0430397.1 hypothetical protein [Salmonella enterica subsp. enterica serovar Soumbedioune]ECT9500472.1 hypothetical protein [Salmonella enterica subsp. enterica serovar Infantis]EDQ6566064.1 hypothetical protein [Salmonella enterica subsp. houtenae]EEJ2343476.1 hypothetical
MSTAILCRVGGSNPIGLRFPNRALTKHHHRFKTPLVWQGDGPLREPSPRTKGILCAVVNH